MIHPVTQVRVPDFLAGVIVPMFTPAREDGNIDYDSLREYTRWLVENPAVTSLFCRSGVGRMYTYRLEEIRKFLDTVMETVGGKKPVLCCTNGEYHGDFSRKTDPVRYLEETLELTEYAKKVGTAAIVLVVPAGLPVAADSTVEETVFAFYQQVHDRTDVSILIYNPQNIPANYSTTPAMIRRVASLSRIIGMKLSTTDLYWMSNLISAANEKEFYMIAGSECAFYQALLTGAVGVIGQGCSTYPHILRRILDAVSAGDLAAARQAQFDVNLALDGFSGLSPDISGFAYLRKKGLQVSPYCRDGSAPLQPEIVETIYRAIEPICQKYMT